MNLKSKLVWSAIGRKTSPGLKKIMAIFPLASCLWLFSVSAIAGNEKKDSMNARLSEKTAEWAIEKINVWNDSHKAPIHVKSKFTTQGIRGTVDFYALGNESDIEWITVNNYELPVKYTYTLLKKRNTQNKEQEAYFPSLNQRVLRHERGLANTKIGQFMMKGPLESFSHDDVASFAQMMQVYEAGNGNYMLNIHVKPEEVQKGVPGMNSLILNTLFNSEGKVLASGMIVNNGKFVVEETYEYPNTKVDSKKIISKYVTPALKAPFIKDKSYQQADMEAINSAGKK